MNTAQRIRNILSASQKARNSDFELWLIYAQKSGVRLSQFQIDKLKEMPSFETIRRTRQKIQQEGELRADPHIEEVRYRKFQSVRGSVGASQPEDIEQQLAKLNLKLAD